MKKVNAMIALFLLPLIVYADLPLTPTGLCINNTNCTSTNGLAASVVAPRSIDVSHFHPGFYFASNYDAISSFDAYKDWPHFVGIKKLYKWRDLETVEGVYDFLGIEADLAHAQSTNKQLWIAISMTQFNGRFGQTPQIILEGTIDRINPWYMFWHKREADRNKGEYPGRFFSNGVIPLLDEYGKHLPAAEAFYGSL